MKNQSGKTLIFEKNILIPIRIQDDIILSSCYGGETWQGKHMSVPMKYKRQKGYAIMPLRLANTVRLYPFFSLQVYGFDADKAAEALGISRWAIFRNRKNIRVQDDTPKKTLGGRRNSSMTIEEELGHDIPLSTTYRLLARHGWRKVQPDTKHPKSDPSVQDEFKKNPGKQWLPPG